MSFAFIRKRSKNYIVYLEYKDSESGKKKQKNMGSFEKKRDASKKLNELKDSIYNDELALPNTMTIEKFLIDFLEKYKVNLSITTYNCYMRICKKYLIPMLGKYKLEELKPIHLQNYVDDLVGILAPQTIKIHINILNLALKKAYRLRLIRENIVECIEVPRIKKFKNNIYNKQDMIKLLQICKGTPLELHIYLASGLGLRISEILGLTWDNIDFNENTITIDKITVRNEGLVILKTPKTESSERTISAPNEIILMLKNYKKKQLEAKLKGEITNKMNLLFFDKNEKLIAQDVLSKKFNKFLRENNLDHIRFHDLRHSHVTLLINSKVPIKVISERVGHSNINTTLNIYAHTLKEMDSEASDKISETLFKLG
ncbi:tyrosine-type recombinase/integrase [Romboutsia sedimentorum]|uniref:Tyrosine-type recombinase/integrase n=1 Tax=Romboutsia sedimentorum TaxID=1368474 RepID=A0ABT7E7K5_9FIRM|nr:tyrosine-type recombinase/integrase [Romboutsia sedimentorum]MDK2561936.1 tyrosine-type recombinase/integrase [Romboutsia sedimentorum]MDK2586730.1 tyrosine-type recombinase/integrase [Romboutsia sedimentorum]